MTYIVKFSRVLLYLLNSNHLITTFNMHLQEEGISLSMYYTRIIFTYCPVCRHPCLLHHQLLIKNTFQQSILWRSLWSKRYTCHRQAWVTFFWRSNGMLHSFCPKMSLLRDGCSLHTLHGDSRTPTKITLSLTNTVSHVCLSGKGLFSPPFHDNNHLSSLFILLLCHNFLFPCLSNVI